MNKPLNQMTDYERYIHTLATTELCRLAQQGNELAKEELNLRYKSEYKRHYTH